MDMKHIAGRRGLIKQTAAMTAGLAGFGMLPGVAAAAPAAGINILGPKPGYSPQVGTMVSMLVGLSLSRFAPARKSAHTSPGSSLVICLPSIKAAVSIACSTTGIWVLYSLK